MHVIVIFSLAYHVKQENPFLIGSSTSKKKPRTQGVKKYGVEYNT